MVTITNITWETDNQDVALPKEVEVEEHLSSEEIAEYISNLYGYLVDSFAMPITDDDIDYFGEYVNEVEGKVS